MIDSVFKISCAKNGLIVDVTCGKGEYQTKDRLVFEEKDDEDEKDCWMGFLRLLTEQYGPMYNKWGKEEIMVVKRPGHKCELEDDVAWFLEDLTGCTYSKEKVEIISQVIRENTFDEHPLIVESAEADEPEAQPSEV